MTTATTKPLRLRPTGLWRRLPFIGGLLLLGILFAACAHPVEEDLWGETLQAESGEVRGLSPEHLRGHPIAMHLDEEEREVYVAMGGTTGRPDNRIAVVDLESGSLLEPITVGMRPLDLQADPKEPDRLFVAHPYSPSISVIDTDTKTTMQIIEAPYYLERIRFDSDGSRLLATDRAGDRLIVFDVERENRGYSLNEQTDIPTGPNPEEIQIIPPPRGADWANDRLVAVSDRHGGSITLVDLETENHRRIPLGGPPLALTARDGLLFIGGVGPGDGQNEELSGTPETGTADLENSLLVLDLRTGPVQVQATAPVPQIRYQSDTARSDNAPDAHRILGGALVRSLSWDDDPLPHLPDTPSETRPVLWVSHQASDQVQALLYDEPAAEAGLDATVLTTRSGTHGERLSHLSTGTPLSTGNLTDTVHGLFETPPGPRATARLDDLLITLAELPEQLHVTNLADCPGPDAPSAPCTTRTLDLVDQPVAYPSGDFERGERLFVSAFPSADQDRSAIMCHPDGLATGDTWALEHRDLEPVKIPRLDQVAENAPWLIDGNATRPEDYLQAAAGDMLRPDEEDPNNLAHTALTGNGTESDENSMALHENESVEARFPGAAHRLRGVDPDVQGPDHWMQLTFAYLLGERRVPPPPPFITTPEGQNMQRGMDLFNDAQVGCASCHIGGQAGNLIDEGESETIPRPPNAERIKAPPLTSVWDREATGLLLDNSAHRIQSTLLPTDHACLEEGETGLASPWHGEATGRTCDSIDDLAAYIRSLEDPR